MNILLFLVTIIVSFTVVRIGAILLQMTGLEWSLAKFQALSCFSGTGYTTKEAELITGHPRRRKIATILMVLGNAGIVALVATFANSIRPRALPEFQIPFLHVVFPSYLLPWINLAIIIIAILILHRMFTRTKIPQRITTMLRKRLAKRQVVKPVSFEELVVATQGYGVSSIEIGRKSPLANKTIKETQLRGKDVNILAIEKEGIVHPNPPSDTAVTPGDRLICFGKLETIRKEIYAEGD